MSTAEVAGGRAGWRPPGAGGSSLDADAASGQLDSTHARLPRIVGGRDGGMFGFVRIEQTVELETRGTSVDAARALADEAEQTCLVSVSLALPVETTVHVSVARPAST